MRVRIFNRIDMSRPLSDFTVPDTNATIAEMLNGKIGTHDLASVSAIVDGVKIPRDLWDRVRLNGVKGLSFVIEPQGTAMLIGALVVALATAVYTFIMMRKLKTKGKGESKSGSSIYDPNAQGNQIKLEQPIPEQFGLVKAFPDYIADKHYYYRNNKRYLDLLLCQGVGHYAWSLDTLYIGNTAISTYSDSDIDVQVFGPGEDLSGHHAHECWYSSTEVGQSGKEVNAQPQAARGTGENLAANVTLNPADSSVTLSFDPQWQAGDIFKISGIRGADVAVAATGTAYEIGGSMRVIVSDFPHADMAGAMGKTASADVTRYGSTSHVDGLTIQNYGETASGDKFIDLSLVSGVSSIENVTAHDFPLAVEAWNDRHFSDNGLYKVLQANGAKLTVQGVRKYGVDYIADESWQGLKQSGAFAGTILTLVDTARSVTSAKSNIAGPYRANPIGQKSNRYEIDLNFPSGLYSMSDSGDYESRSAQILIEYRKAGSTDEWTKIQKTYTAASPDEIGETLEITTPETEAYEFKVTNESQFSDSSQVQQNFMWGGLRCLIAAPTSYEGVTVIAMTVRGSAQLAELGDNQISTLWSRRIAPLKNEAATVTIVKEVDGYSKTGQTPEEIASRARLAWNEQKMSIGTYYAITEHERGNPLAIWRLPAFCRTKKIHLRAYAQVGLFDHYTKNARNGFFISFDFVVYQPRKNSSSALDESSGFTIYVSAPTWTYAPSGAEVWESAPVETYLLKGCKMEAPSTSNKMADLTHLWSPDYAPRYKNGEFDKTPGPLFTFDHDLEIEHTPEYIAINGEIVARAEDFPTISTHFSDHFAMGMKYQGSTTPREHFVGIKDLSIGYPSRVTVVTTEKTATIGEDIETDRSIAAPIKAIAAGSVFGAEMLDGANLAKYDKIWRDAGLNFDFRFDNETTVLEAIQQCAQVGYAEPIVCGNVIRMTAKTEDAPISQIFTPASMTGEPKITYTFRTPDDADEIDAKYMEPATWKSAEVYTHLDADGEAVTDIFQTSPRTEKMEVLAITDREKLEALSARRLRELMYSRKQIEFQTELAALNCQYGDKIAVCLPQDLLAFSGRIIGYDADSKTLTLSDGWDGETAIIYAERPDGTAQEVAIAEGAGDVVTLSEPLDFEPETGTTAYAFGRIEEYWVTSVKPSAQGKCSVTAIIADKRIHKSDPYGRME